ncbi:MAG: Calx-beta domain-containing protein [Chloroflexota bacterium]
MRHVVRALIFTLAFWVLAPATAFAAAPVVTIASGNISYTENQSPTPIDSGLTVTDDGPTLTSATFTISSGYAGAEDELQFTDQNGIAGSYSGGMLTLTGLATVAEYETAMRSVAYFNNSDRPNTAARNVLVQVNDGTGGAGGLSALVGRVITVTPVNDPPVANADTYSVGANNTLAVNTLAGVLSNDTDPENQALSATVVTTTSHGSLTLLSGGNFTYTPNPNYLGDDSFVYHAYDGAAFSGDVTATIHVTGSAITIDDITVAEGDSGTTSATFTVTITPPLNQTITVFYATSNLSATSGEDYAAVGLTQLTFDPLQASQTLTINVFGDYTIESNEAFSVNLSGAVNGIITKASGTATITNDDAAGTIEFSATNYSVGEGAGTATITVNRTGGNAPGVSVNYATSDDSAVAGQDYTTTAGTLTFAGGETSKTFTVPILADTLSEPSEAINLALSTPTNGATLGTIRNAVLTITNDDVAGSLQLSGATYSVAESAGTVTITVTRTGGTASGVTAQYSTGNGTAQAGADYTATTGMVTFGAGDTEKTFTVPILVDSVAEGAETFTVTLTSPGGGASLGTPTAATVTISDDDTAGVVQLGSATYTFAEGAGNAVVVITRTGGAASGVGVTYATTDGTARAGSDYTNTTGTVTFGANETEKSIQIPLLADSLSEGSETLTFALSNPTGGATLGATTTATVTVTDDDLGGTIQFSSPTFTGSEGAGAATITVTRSGGAASGVSVSYATANGTAQAGADYTATTGTVTFAAGETSKTFTVPILADTISDPNETVNLTLSAPTGGASLGATTTATLTITDDDSGGTIQFSAANFNASEGGATATVTVTRIGGAASGVTVQYATADGTAKAGQDYTATGGTLSFGANEDTKTFTIAIILDTVVEGNETIQVSLASPTGGASLGQQNTATVTLVEDDAGGTVKLSASVYSASEKDGSASFTVTRTGGAASGVSVNYTVVTNTPSGGSPNTRASGAGGNGGGAVAANAAGSQRAPSDPAAGTPSPTEPGRSGLSGVVTFGAGETSKKVSIALTNDTITSTNAVLYVTIAGPTGGATLGDPAAATIYVQDDDAGGGIQFSSSTFSVNENAGNALITVTRSGGTASGVSVTVSTANGTAVSPVDYSAIAGVISFAAGETSKTVAIPIINDQSIEGNETVLLSLTNPTGGASLGSRATATLTIVDDEGVPTITGVDGVLKEAGASPSGKAMVFIVGLSVPSTQTVTLAYVTADDSAQAGMHYQSASGVISFAPGETAKQVAVNALPKGIEEGNKMFFLKLSNVVNATIPAPSQLLAEFPDNGPYLHEDGNKRKLTELQKLQKDHSNQMGFDNYGTQGDVLSVDLKAEPPTIVIGNVDGKQVLVLRCKGSCATPKPGDYVEADGEKENEGLFWVDELKIKNP